MKNNFDINLINGVKIILFQLGNLKKSESLCIISDTNTKNLGELFEYVSRKMKIKTTHKIIKPLTNHGQNLPTGLEETMKNSELTVAVTNTSIAHSPQRVRVELLGKRFLSLPDYSFNLLKHPAIKADYKTLARKAKKMSNILTKGNSVQIKTTNGTDLNLEITNRNGNYAPGFVNKDILLGSPPDIEANIAPLETKTNGKIVVDGSIPHRTIGKLESPIILTIKNGKIIKFEGNNKIISILEKLFMDKSKNKILGEFGVGFNDKAKLCGIMLLDEGCFGTFHFGFGSNILLGGINKSDFHLDLVVFANELSVDGKIINLKYSDR